MGHGGDGHRLLRNAALVAQTTAERPDGSMASLTAELRQLREAVEALTKVQAQTQALGVYLSAQQSRLTQTAARVDAVQKDLERWLAVRGFARLAQLNESCRALAVHTPGIADARAMTADRKGSRRSCSSAARRRSSCRGRWTDSLAPRTLMAR